MKVTVYFGNVRVIVPCGRGDMLVKELISKATSRYKKATLKPTDHIVNVISLKNASDGGILDPDDLLSDVADDREQILALFEEEGHSRADGTSDSSSPDYTSPTASTHKQSDWGDIDVNTSSLPHDDVVISQNDLKEPSPLKVRIRRNSDTDTDAAAIISSLKMESPKGTIKNNEGDNRMTMVKSASSDFRNTKHSYDDTSTFANVSKRPHHPDVITRPKSAASGALPSSFQRQQLYRHSGNIERWIDRGVKDTMLHQHEHYYDSGVGSNVAKRLSPAPLMNGHDDGLNDNFNNYNHHRPSSNESSSFFQHRREPVGAVNPPAFVVMSTSSANIRNDSSQGPIRKGQQLSQAKLVTTKEESHNIILRHDSGTALGIHVIPAYGDLNPNDNNDRKKSNSGIGLLVQDIEDDGPVKMDGRLNVHDRIVEINGQSLEHISFAEAQERFKYAMRSNELRIRFIRSRPITSPTVSQSALSSQTFIPSVISSSYSHYNSNINDDISGLTNTDLSNDIQLSCLAIEFIEISDIS